MGWFSKKEEVTDVSRSGEQTALNDGTPVTIEYLYPGGAVVKDETDGHLKDIKREELAESPPKEERRKWW
jgi:hypothetical protein